jgi:hypothetical protein
VSTFCKAPTTGVVLKRTGDVVTLPRAKLFGERRIRDESPLVYLVAPTLRVHPSFQTLARCIDSDIEVYRFDINEDWRAGVRVMRRTARELVPRSE